MMRLARLAVAALVVAGGLAVAHAEAPGPSCEVRKAGGVSFRSATARDVLEVSVGSGPCATARLSIMIRSDGGRVLYDYAQGFAQHVVYTDQDPLHLQAVPFVDRLIADGVEMSDRLPPWQAPDAYEVEHLAMILIDRAAYERLRQVARPLFSHPTYHESWRSVVWDEARGKSVTVVEGGS